MTKKKTTKKELTADVINSDNGDGFSATAYRGDGTVLLAFDLAEKPGPDFAGFAVKRIPPKGRAVFVPNRLSFAAKITSATKPGQRKLTPSNLAPFQKFRWMDFPSEIQAGNYVYEITPMFCTKSDALKSGTPVRLEFEMTPENFGNFEMGFTRGFLSSQAYADRFKNAAIRPPGGKTMDFDTKAFEKQYEWLGFHARKMVFGFLSEALRDKDVKIDVFAYDLDEPDFVRLLIQFGDRLRIFLDNAPLHTKAGAVEPQVAKALVQSAGAENVKTGHFHRFAHNKVIIQKRGGQAEKVLTGSANFSVRGLYAQANNILIFNDATSAGLFEQAFEQAFTNEPGFAASQIARDWNDIKVDGCPDCSVAFSPHKTAAVSLTRVADAIKNAKSSVMFAIMELGGSGVVLDEIKNLDLREIFSYGVTQSEANLKFFKPGRKTGTVLSFEFLKDKIPEPFKKEWSGGQGQVVHHKFVVVDFNAETPVLFTGSSNLAAGGETSNGDNLFEIRDRGIATAYAVEAVRLLDHYNFRAVMKTATKVEPLRLKSCDEKVKWWQPYYDRKNIKYNERLLFSRNVK